MTGDTIINNVDIYTTYGAFVSYEGYRGVMEWPATKPVVYNDWQEENGIEADLSQLFFESHEAELSFGIQRPIEEIHFLYDFLCTSPTMTCSLNSVGITNKTYRIIGMSSLDYAFAFGIIKVRVADDSPMEGYSYLAPSVVESVPTSVFQLDSVPLSNYGVRTLYGTLGSIASRGAVKSFLLRSNSIMNGSHYDENPNLWDATTSSFKRSTTHGTPKAKAVEINLKCALGATNKTEFWRNYNALLYDLVKQDTQKAGIHKCERAMSMNSTLLTCYYEGQTIDDFYMHGSRLTAQFTISMLVLAGLSEDLIRFLEAESGILVITEDGQFIRV